MGVVNGCGSGAEQWPRKPADANLPRSPLPLPQPRPYLLDGAFLPLAAVSVGGGQHGRRAVGEWVGAVRGGQGHVG